MFTEITELFMAQMIRVIPGHLVRLALQMIFFIKTAIALWVQAERFLGI